MVMAYHCKHCGKTVARDSDKQWIKSYCTATGKTTHIQLCRPDPAKQEAPE